MAKHSTTAYQKLMLNIEASIKRVKGLATDETLELNKKQCKYLSDKLQAGTAQFLRKDDVRIRILGHESTPRVSNALLQIYSVVRRAENLVQLCCESEHSTWLTLLNIKEDVLLIYVDVRWWTSILSMVIGVGRNSNLSTPDRVKLLNEKFEETLKDNVELQKAYEEDRKDLLKRVNGALQIANRNKSGFFMWKQYDADSLLLLQVRALLTYSDMDSIPELNQYTQDRINSLIGKGGFGVVHRVTWCGQECVLKRYDISKLEDIEVDALKRLHHPHIVRFFRDWKDERSEEYKSHILMERMDRDLARHIESEQKKLSKTRPFSVPVAIDIMLQVIKAIFHVHKEEFAHRDLKPGNVLVRVNGGNVAPELAAEGYVEVKLGDFGTARRDMWTSQAEALTFKVGTTLYRAPELSELENTEGGRRVAFGTKKIDMWSFGIMCSQILTGQQPFKEKPQGITLEAYIEHGGRPFLPNESCPDYLRFCVKRCLEYEPRNRPKAVEMWRMLRVAQLRSLGLIDENYDFFNDDKKQASQGDEVGIDPEVASGGEEDCPISFSLTSDCQTNLNIYDIPSGSQPILNFYRNPKPSQSSTAKVVLSDTHEVKFAGTNGDGQSDLYKTDQSITNPNYLKKVQKQPDW